MGDDEEAFLATILEDPSNNVPRLVFADWLDERAAPGDAARAEFIRLTVDQPDVTFWPHGVERCGIAERPGDERLDRAFELCRDHRERWLEQDRLRLEGSPFCRWLGGTECRWAHRRGFVTVFEGTQHVLLDAWDDLFRLGPIEELLIRRLWHFGTVSSLRVFLNQPCLRVLRLYADELRDDDIERLMNAANWLRRFEKVELLSERNHDGEAATTLRAWLASEATLKHVKFEHGWAHP